MLEWILGIVLPLVNSNPYFSTVIMIVGIFRVVMKPLMVLLETIVKATPIPDDDKVFYAFQKSKAYEVIVFILDYLTSIKLPKPPGK